jgi:mRNA interferase RelE/StbE
MKLLIAKSAQKTLALLQPKLAAALIKEMMAIAAEPFGHHPNAKRMKGGEAEYRLRHGDWRVLYRLDREADTMFVNAIDTRGDIYK